MEISTFLKNTLETKGKLMNVNDLLCEAVQQSSTNVIEYLIRQGGDVNYMNGELLCLAVKSQNYDQSRIYS
jgi:hypothetical protein